MAAKWNMISALTALQPLKNMSMSIPQKTSCPDVTVYSVNSNALIQKYVKKVAKVIKIPYHIGI